MYSLMQEVLVVFYESIKLNEHEKNYVTHDLELAVIMHVLKMLRNYLLSRKFVLMLDHGGLMYMFDQPKLNARHARWITLISDFYFEIKYFKGKEKKLVDALSKRLHVAIVAVLNFCESKIHEKIKEVIQQDEHYQKIKECLQQERKLIMNKIYSIKDDGLL